MKTKRDYIGSSELFSGIEQNTIERIMERFHEVTFAQDDILCKEGETGDRMFIITDGEVSVRKEMGWGHRELRRLKDGEVVGEMSLISEEKRSATVQALKKTTCLQLSKSDFANLLDSDPHIAQQVAIILTKRLSVLGRSTSQEILNAYRALMFSLANLADSRDPETGAHLNRTRSYCALLAEKAIGQDEYKDALYPGFIESIYQVSPLHDIGKVAIPDSILLKPGKLTDEEFGVMKSHSSVGAQSLQGVLEYSDEEIFHMAHRICLHHHEKWDGSGYPVGLAGSDIPLEARIMAFADVYDALLSKRVYKPPMPFEDAVAEIKRMSGWHFDPGLTKIMLDNIGQFETIHKHYQLI